MGDVEQDRQGWTGRSVRGRDGTSLGTLGEVVPAGSGGRSWGVVRSRFGRRRLVPLDDAKADDDRTLTVPVDRATVRSAPSSATGSPDAETTASLQDHYAGRGALADAQERQRARFGGTSPGAAFFGWLVAVGMTVLLSAIAAGVGAAVGTGMNLDPRGADATGIGVTGALVLLAVLLIAYFAGGYVAGRLARFDGARNGVLAWVIGVVVAVLAAVTGTVLGSQPGVATQLQLPAVPGDLAALTIGGVIALVVVLVGTLAAAALGGRMGERFHRRVDREGTRAR